MKKSLHQADSFFIPSSLWHSCGLFIRFPPQENLQAEQPVQPPQLLCFPAFLRRIIILTAATIAPAIRIRSTIEAKFIFSPLLACISILSHHALHSRLFSSCCPHQMSIPGVCRIQHSALLTDTPFTSSCQPRKWLQHTARLSRIEGSLPVQPICLQVLFLSMWSPQHMAYTAGRKPKVLLPQPESAKMWPRCHPSEPLKLLQHSLLP